MPFETHDIHYQAIDVYGRAPSQRAVGIDMDGTIWFAETVEDEHGDRKSILAYSLDSGVTWTNEEMQTYIPNTWATCLAVGSSGVYTMRSEHESGWPTTYHSYFRKVGGADEELTPLDDYWANKLAMGVDADERVHAVGIRQQAPDANYQDLRYRNRSPAGAWSDFETVVASIYTGGGVITGELITPTMCVDINGLVHVVYQEWDTPDVHTHLRHVYRTTDGVWHGPTDIGRMDDNLPSDTDCFSIAADLLGNVHLAYWNDIGGAPEGIAYRSWNAATGWSAEEQIYSSDCAWFPSIGVTSSNHILITFHYLDFVTDTGYFLLAEYDGSWAISTITTTGSYTESDYLQGNILYSSLYPVSGSIRPSLQPSPAGIVYRWRESYHSWFGTPAPIPTGGGNLIEVVRVPRVQTVLG